MFCRVLACACHDELPSYREYKDSSYCNTHKRGEEPTCNASRADLRSRVSREDNKGNETQCSSDAGRKHKSPRWLESRLHDRAVFKGSSSADPRQLQDNHGELRRHCKALHATLNGHD